MDTGGPVLGFGLPVSGSWATPEAMVRVATAAEAAGYQSLWGFQRLLYPDGADWGAMYESVHDPLIALAHVAAVTRTPRLGVAVLNVPYYAPLVLAKQLTTLDVVSAGRLDVGLGLGWAPQEMQAVGAPMAGRGARAEEFVRCLTSIWSQDPVRFDGDLFQVPAAHVRPRPVQRPHPPLLLGGTAERALRRAGRLADGWISASRHDLSRIGQAVRTISDAAAQAGRDPQTLRFVVRGVVHLGRELRGRDGGRRPLTGSAEQIREDLLALRAAGVTEVFIDPNFHPEVGTPHVEASDGERVAMRLLETFAPAG